MNSKNRKGDERSLTLHIGQGEVSSNRYSEFASSRLIDDEHRGNVIARIIEDRTHGGSILHMVELSRSYLMSKGSGETSSFLEPDVSDAIHCLKWSQNWFWHQERGRRMKRANNSRPIVGSNWAWSPRPEQFTVRDDRFHASVASRQVAGDQSGNVAYRIFENETHAREVIYKVELVRIYTTGKRSGDAFNFPRGDVLDAIRCLKWSREWLRQDRRGRLPMRSRFWF